MTKNPEDVRICNDCGGAFPATDRFFYSKSGRRGSLEHRCIECRLRYSRAYKKRIAAELRDKIRARRAQDQSG